ncbi:orotate phosphoribosyltransferase [Leptospira sp. 96542]|nr:orotate phosphoribosyltransferase [Leptospira sp. 96542]
MSHALHGQLLHWMKSEVYRFSETPFLLASGIQSQHYFNCKKITLHPERLSVLADCFVEEIISPEFGDFQAVGGLTLGADPISYAIALSFQKKGKCIYPLVIRKETKGHGTGQQIEGFWQNVKRCLILDDVITTGGSTLKAVNVLRDVGIEVDLGLCILDREEGGRQNLENSGIKMHSIFKKSDFLS